MPEDNFADLLKTTLDLGASLADAATTEKVHYTVIPAGYELRSLQYLQYPFGIPPERIIANVQLRDAASFAEYVTAFRDARSCIFAEPAHQRFLAVLDYHIRPQGQESDSSDKPLLGVPQYGDHKATFQMTLDDRWKIWNEQDNVAMSQSAFAEFCEDNKADLLEPAPAVMLEIARDLSAKTEVSFGSSVRLNNGQTRLRYEETVKAGVPAAGDIEVPEEFLLKIPVFYGEDPIEIRARLRFRINQGKLTFHYKLYRPSQVLNDAFNAAVRKLEEALGAGILLGSPA